MQPYQEATQEIRRQGELPVEAAKTLGSIGATVATAYAGGSAASKVLSLINRYVPADLAMKGLNKIDPRYGKFINKALSAGQSFEEIRNFIGEKAEEGMEEEKPKEKEPAKEKRNIIEQYSPELHQFIAGEVGKGRRPIEAAAIAQNDKRFSDIIKKMSKDHKTPWSSIIESIFGGGQTAQPSQSMGQPQQMQAQQQPQQMQPQGQQSQASSGQQALMSVLQKINQRLGSQ